MINIHEIVKEEAKVNAKAKTDVYINIQKQIYENKQKKALEQLHLKVTSYLQIEESEYKDVLLYSQVQHSPLLADITLNSIPINSIIPLNIYQYWNSLNLPKKLKENVDLIKKNNPEFKYYLYDDEMCRKFIKHNFDKDALYSFDKLKPGAYKTDLWIYCMLYINGGIYLDITYKCINNFSLINLTTKEYYKGIYNKLLIFMPNSKLLFKCIQLIIKNIKNNNYGYSELHITGPQMMSSFFDDHDIQNLNTNLNLSNCGKYILFNNNKILQLYSEEQNQLSFNDNICDKNITNYKVCWLERDVYKYPTLRSHITYNYTKEINKSNIKLYSGTPTIIETSNNEYLINIRWINYTYNENGTKKDIPQYWISINSIFKVDKYFNKISDEIFLKKNNNLTIGFEDIRLFNYEDNYYYISTYYDNNRKNLAISSDIIDNDIDIDISNNSYNLYKNIILPNMYDLKRNKIIEKNWVFVTYNNNLCIIYNWFPIQIGQIDYTNNKMDIIDIKYNIPEYFKNARGSTCGYIKNNEIWFVVHKAQHSSKGHYNYQHFFAIFDLEMNIIRYSELFKLGNSKVEYCLGLIVKDTTIILSYSLLDTQCMVSEYDIDYINNNIKWYT